MQLYVKVLNDDRCPDAVAALLVLVPVLAILMLAIAGTFELGTLIVTVRA